MPPEAVTLAMVSHSLRTYASKPNKLRREPGMKETGPAIGTVNSGFLRITYNLAWRQTIRRQHAATVYYSSMHVLRMYVRMYVYLLIAHNRAIRPYHPFHSTALALILPRRDQLYLLRKPLIRRDGGECMYVCMHVCMYVYVCIYVCNDVCIFIKL